MLRFDKVTRAIYKRRYYLAYFKYVKKYKPEPDALPEIDVFIPVIERDLEVLKFAVTSLKDYSCNPIKNIYIVAPKSDKIRAYAEETNCIFIDESQLIDNNIADKAVDTDERFNWYHQQFLKFSWDKVSDSKFCLIYDADTVLLKKHTFVGSRKIYLECADEFHQPYFDLFYKLFGFKIKLPISFITHHMVFERESFNAMKTDIETRFKKFWLPAITDNIDFTQSSGFSEYETYAHYVLHHCPEKVEIIYESNVSLTRSLLTTLPDLVSKYASTFTFASFHHYNN